MTAYILRRVLISIPILLGITLITFIIVNAAGDPFAGVKANPKTRPEDIARIREIYGLDQPLFVRYVTWLSHLARGDFGISLTNATPVGDRIRGALPNTLLLATSALVVEVVLAIPLGIYSAVKLNSLFDRAVTVLSVAGSAIPPFWLALLLIILFASKFREWGLPALPVSGLYDLRGDRDVWDRLEHLILPTTAVAIGGLAGATRYIRSQMLEVIRQDYVQTARSKGLTERVVILRHAFRNALTPFVTLLGLSLPDLVGGAFITETVFAWPGIGRLTVEAARTSDYTLIMATVLMLSALTLLGNLLADVAYGFVDPRIRYA